MKELNATEKTSCPLPSRSRSISGQWKVSFKLFSNEFYSYSVICSIWPTKCFLVLFVENSTTTKIPTFLFCSFFMRCSLFSLSLASSSYLLRKSSDVSSSLSASELRMSSHFFDVFLCLRSICLEYS